MLPNRMESGSTGPVGSTGPAITPEGDPNKSIPIATIATAPNLINFLNIVMLLLEVPMG